jgi:flagellin
MGLRINHNLASLGAALNLGRANAALSSSLAKLSTGLKINTAADGPADLIISEKFRSQINAISKATENTQNAISMLSTAEGALAEVNSLLTKMQGLALKATQTGTQSPDEIAASQAEIDAALDSINSISRNTSFGSVNLLDGSKSVETTGVNTDNILVDIEDANFAGATKDLSVEVVTAAQRASVALDFTVANDSVTTAGELSTAQVIKITGNRGSHTFTFAAGSSESDISEEINSVVNQTGVIATVASNTMTLQSAKYGASEFVTVEDVDGTNDFLKTTATTPSVNGLNTLYKLDDSATTGLVLVTTSSAYTDYTVSVTMTASVGGAGSVSVDTNAKTIEIFGSTGATRATVALALNTDIGTANLFNTSDTQALTANTVNTTNSITASGPQLTIDVKNGVVAPGTGFTFTVSAQAGAASAITYSTAGGGGAILLQVSAGATINDAALQNLIASSANRADIENLFTFGTLTGSVPVNNINPVSFTGNVDTSFVKDEGADGQLEVNGVKTAANNLKFTFDNGNIRGNITINESFNASGSRESFTLSGKGAFLQIGSKAQLSHQVGVGIKSVAVDQLATGLYLDSSLDPSTTSIDNSNLYTTATLGDIKAGGDFDLANDAQTAYDIIDTAITEIAVQRARIGAFISNTLESNVNSLGVAFENLTASESRIRDVDFAAETAEFTRAQILVQAGTSVAAQANVATQAALQLLG